MIVRESGSDPAGAPVYLLTDTGFRYELIGTAALRLGHDGISSCRGPSPWPRLVPGGDRAHPDARVEELITLSGGRGVLSERCAALSTPGRALT